MTRRLPGRAALCLAAMLATTPAAYGRRTQTPAQGAPAGAQEGALIERLTVAAKQRLQSDGAALDESGERALGEFIAAGAAALARDGAGEGQASEAERGVRRFAGLLARNADTALSGTYAGVVNDPGANLSGPAKLTVAGDTFTLESEGVVRTGELSTLSWPGQTAVALRFDAEGAAADTVSLRARVSNDTLTLRSAPGEPKQFSFRGTASGTVSGGAPTITAQVVRRARGAICPLYPFC